MTTVSDPQTSKVVPLLQTLARRVEAADPSRHREITNAMTGEPLGRVPHCTAADEILKKANRQTTSNAGH